MFKEWNDYFLMIGSSAAALIGLMFIVVTLTAGRDRRETERGKHLYTSPVVGHLGVVLLLSGGAIAPAMTPAWFGVASAGIGLIGLVICVRNGIAIAGVRMSGDDNSRFDMWWYGFVPGAVYAALGIAAVAMLARAAWGESAFAAALMALLLVSIHAEWDLVTFLAPMAPASDSGSQN